MRSGLASRAETCRSFHASVGAERQTSPVAAVHALSPDECCPCPSGSPPWLLPLSPPRLLSGCPIGMAASLAACADNSFVDADVVLTTLLGISFVAAVPQAAKGMAPRRTAQHVASFTPPGSPSTAPWLPANPGFPALRRRLQGVRLLGWLAWRYRPPTPGLAMTGSSRARATAAALMAESDGWKALRTLPSRFNGTSRLLMR